MLSEGTVLVYGCRLIITKICSLTNVGEGCNILVAENYFNTHLQGDSPCNYYIEANIC